MSQLTVIQLPQAHELSGLASLRESDSVLRQYRRANVSNAQERSMVQELNNALRKLEKMRRRILGGAQPAAGDSWPPVELDTTVAHSIGDRVYISPGNILVTAGMIDLDSNILTVSLPGIWRAVTAVPAAVSSQYNVPQLPIPGASGAVPSGTPMKGDADGAQVHWLPEWINDYCSQNP